jgi:hypothetical protein
VASFRAHGLTLWDNQWFGGNWTVSYSVLFPALGGLAGVAVVTVGAAAIAAPAFDRIAVSELGAGGRPAAVVFALGTAVQSAIGQLPFLAGEAFGVCAGWAALRRRWGIAGGLALAASLTSQLAGIFVVMAMAAWIVSRWTDRSQSGMRLRAAGVMVAGMAPLGVSAGLFPGQGFMPYPIVEYLWEVLVAGGLWLIAGPEHHTIRAGAGLFVVAATAAVLVPSPLGGNVGRIEDVLALPLAVGVLWGRTQLGWRVVLSVVAVPVVLSQWGPAWGAMTADAGRPSTHRSFFELLVRALSRAAAGGPAGRVEVVPTRFHWEAVYVASHMPLARGWERQFDTEDNPLFYRASAGLDAATYRAWLIDNGVRFVALAAAPLDYAGVAEGRVVAAGVPGLQLVWRSRDWRLYRVAGSSGIVAALARLVRQDGSRIVATTPSAGSVVVRVRYNSNWELTSGAGCVAPAPARVGPGVSDGTWVRVQAPAAERFSLQLSLLPDRSSCPAAG